MRGTVTPQSGFQAICHEIHELGDVVLRFTPKEGMGSLLGTWIPRSGMEKFSPHRQFCLMADATLLGADLLKSQPSASGSNAFDRMAKSLGKPTAAMAALCAARFRLLEIEKRLPGFETAVRDVVSGVAFRLVEVDLARLANGARMFGRVAMLGDEAGTFCGSITPLDMDAFDMARGHPLAGAPGMKAGARWAEAVYKHVVRNGTLDVPGVNRPREDWDEDASEDSDPLFDLSLEWKELTGEPDADLLLRTRELTSLDGIVNAIDASMMTRKAGEAAMANALERIVVVQIETVLRRERSGSGTLTLDGVGAAVEAAVAAGRLSAAARALWLHLRRRLGAAGVRTASEPGLEKLMQRLQGLRAKTVEQGCTEQEAMAAAAKVAELLDRHGLSLGELEFRAQPCEGLAVETDRRRTGPVDRCVPDIAAFFDCRVWGEQAKGSTRRYVFFGLRGDVTAARYLYELVEQAFATETDAFRAGPLYAAMVGERRTATNSFQVGMAEGIIGKLRAMRAGRDAARVGSTGRDLVTVKGAMLDEEMGKLGLALRLRTTKSDTRVLTDAFDAGEAAGREFEYRAGIEEAA